VNTAAHSNRKLVIAIKGLNSQSKDWR